AMLPTEASRYIYGTTLFSRAREVGDYIRKNSAATSRLAVIGSEPEIYFYSHRRSATGYIYVYPLMEIQPYAEKMQKEMIAEIEKNQPEFVLYVDDNYSWLEQDSSVKHVDTWWGAFAEKRLDVISTTSIEGREDEGV